ncbi:MAG TPA: phosphogluconate dehydratase, partial [Methylotenera sp.]|nr:phosphogluconate dehydratase [Methylotenera sp.]
MKQSHVEVTERIIEKSRPTRSAYLHRVDAMLNRKKGADRLGCANVAHAFAAMPANDKLRVVAEKATNIAIVTAYNEMLSAHQPYVNYPEILRDEARKHGATVQVAGGVPAMCDG